MGDIGYVKEVEHSYSISYAFASASSLALALALILTLTLTLSIEFCARETVSDERCPPYASVRHWCRCNRFGHGPSAGDGW